MNARIDIVTPSGKSLEGYPFNFNQNTVDIDLWNNVLNVHDYFNEKNRNTTLHPGDKIVIEILSQ